MNTYTLKKEELENKAALVIQDKISTTLLTKEKCVFTVAGGSSVVGIFNKLALLPIPWYKVHIFLADERNVPIESDDSNYKNLYKHLISKINITAGNINYFDINQGDELALKRYQESFDNLGKSSDVILLSAGADGHIASLFPNHPALNDNSGSYIKVMDSPKPPSERFSMSLSAIKNSKSALLLFIGSEKNNTYDNFLNDQLEEKDCPAKAVKNILDTHVFVDVIE